MTMIIDATNLLVGRMATKVAKAAILGEEIHIVNCEKAVISGRKRFTLGRYDNAAKRGNPAKGPWIPKQAHLFVKRVIRGMLPHRQTPGREALSRIKCYVGVPESFKNAKFDKVEGAELSKLQVLKYATISDINHHIGGKQ